MFLALASLALLGVIAAQDYLYAPLRQETISAGLSGPYHWWLDGSYVVLAAALILGTQGRPLMLACASVAAVALLLVAATNTFAPFVDKLTGGKHALWHSRFTVVVFVAAFALEISGNRGSAPLWGLTLMSAIAPFAIYELAQRSDYAEKLGVLGICIWLASWA